MSKILQQKMEMGVRKATHLEKATNHTCRYCENMRQIRFSEIGEHPRCGFIGDGAGKRYMISEKDTCTKFKSGDKVTQEEPISTDDNSGKEQNTITFYKFCYANCKHLSVTERQQKINKKEVHTCLRYNKQVLHKGNHPDIVRLDECTYDRSTEQEQSDPRQESATADAQSAHAGMTRTGESA